MCGGTWITTGANVPTTGLSPRVRGNPHRAGSPDPRAGSIPACAGEPSAKPFNSAAMTVYPRVCGGTQYGHRKPAQRCGLSPRVRGNHTNTSATPMAHRSIPACAGEPSVLVVVTFINPVYPRVCGGTNVPVIGLSATPGLSPRVRGNLAARPAVPLCARSIPACAGEPCTEGFSSVPTQVYPRVCGGTAISTACSNWDTGLSPRVRGNHDKKLILGGACGSIPACAGEPIHHDVDNPLYQVYPRVCGGTDRPVLESGRQKGLSPRVRGNPSGSPAAPPRPGSIPACAGEPLPHLTRSDASQVYPRVCGGTVSDTLNDRAVDGLSPRVRGNPESVPRPGLARRSIPACAGEPPTLSASA